jgi:hypothetical protein
MESDELYKKVKRWIDNRESKSLDCTLLYAMLNYIEEHEGAEPEDYSSRSRDKFTRDMFD